MDKQRASPFRLPDPNTYDWSSPAPSSNPYAPPPRYSSAYRRWQRTRPPFGYIFADSDGPGYGGPQVPWPFDPDLLLSSWGYRRGVRNAILAQPRWAAPNWVHAARKLFVATIANE